MNYIYDRKWVLAHKHYSISFNPWICNIGHFCDSSPAKMEDNSGGIPARVSYTKFWIWILKGQTFKPLTFFWIYFYKQSCFTNVPSRELWWRSFLKHCRNKMCFWKTNACTTAIFIFSFENFNLDIWPWTWQMTLNLVPTSKTCHKLYSCEIWKA